MKEMKKIGQAFLQYQIKDLAQKEEKEAIILQTDPFLHQKENKDSLSHRTTIQE